MEKENDKVIIVEPSTKSDLFINYLKDVVFNVLSENSISLLSLTKDGYYYVITLKKSDELVFTMNLLTKIPGISYVFIAKSFMNNYDLLSKSAVSIWKDLLFSCESFHIKIVSSILNKNDAENLILKDLEFFLISEMISICADAKYVKNEETADKIFFILIGTKYAYVSLIFAKLKNAIPFNFMNEKVTCAIYNNYSFLSIDSILKNGFSPLFFFFYFNRDQLLKFLKIFNKIIKNYPLWKIEINLIDLNKINSKLDQLYKNFNSSNLEDSATFELFKEQIILFFLFNLNDNNPLCLSFSPLIHPYWFVKKNILLSFQSNKIPLLPFMFECESKNNLVNFYKSNNLIINDHEIYSTLDANQITFDDLYQKMLGYLQSIDDINRNIVNIKLDLRKDDVLDILNSV